MYKQRQKGFTLIELIMVIVILGILAATALPKFADLSTSAESAAVEGARGAVKAGMAIAHAQSLIEGEASAATSEITVQGVPIKMIFGYPIADDVGSNSTSSANQVTDLTAKKTIAEMAGISVTDFAITDTGATDPGATMTFTKGACSFIYTEATSASVPAVVSVVTGTDC